MHHSPQLSGGYVARLSKFGGGVASSPSPPLPFSSPHRQQYQHLEVEAAGSTPLQQQQRPPWQRHFHSGSAAEAVLFNSPQSGSSAQKVKAPRPLSSANKSNGNRGPISPQMNSGALRNNAWQGAAAGSNRMNFGQSLPTRQQHRGGAVQSSGGRGRGGGAMKKMLFSGNMSLDMVWKGPKELSSILRKKLEGLMAVREQIESLTARHRHEENELANAMATMAAEEETLREKTKNELMQLVEEKNKAIQMLDVFRQEGNRVITRMHESLRYTHQQSEEQLAKIDFLSNDNERLKALLQQQQVLQQRLPELNLVARGDGDEAEAAAAAQESIAELDSMLQEADAVIVNLRSQNEALLQQNEMLRERLLKYEGGDLINLDADGITGEDAGEGGGDEGEDKSPEAQLSVLKKALHLEKRHRLEAEELSHKLLLEHQKNVALLEQRLHRDRGSTPRSATPKRARGGFSSPGAPSTPHLTQTTVAEKSNGIDGPDGGGTPSDSLSGDKREDCKEATAAAVGDAVVIEKVEQQEQDEDDAEHLANMKELEAIEQQLQQVADKLNEC